MIEFTNNASELLISSGFQWFYCKDIQDMPRQSLITNFFKLKPKPKHETKPNDNHDGLCASLCDPDDNHKRRVEPATKSHFNASQKWDFHKKHRARFVDADAKKTWNNYFFVASDNFTEYSVINIIHRCMKERYFGPNYTVATATVDGDSALTGIYVEPEFRRHHIGTELIRFIKEVCPQFYVYTGTEHHSRYTLTTEGAGLIRSCEQKKILSSDQVIPNEVPPSPSVSRSSSPSLAYEYNGSQNSA